jgi:tryptophanyl-tRNA synthetase
MSGPALLLLGFAVTGRPATGSGLLASLTIAAAAGGPVFGALLDRSRRPDRLLAGTLAAYAAGIVAVQAAVGRLAASAVIVVALAAGLFNPAITGGWTAQLPRVVSGRELDRGSAFDAMTYSAASLAGPALAAAVAAGFGARTAVLSAAALVLVAVPSACSLSRFRPDAADRIAQNRIAQDRIVRNRIIQGLVALQARALGRQMAAGFAAIATRRPLLRATVTSVVSYAGIGMLLVCCPLLGAQRLGGAAHGALLISAMAVASLAVNAILARRAGRGRPDVRVLASTLVIGAGMAAAALASGWLTLAAVALTGAGEGPQLSALFAVRHRETPAGLRGQVYTTAASLKIAGMASGAALAGPLAGRSVTGCLLAAAGTELCAAAAYMLAGAARAGRHAPAGASPRHAGTDASPRRAGTLASPRTARTVAAGNSQVRSGLFSWFLLLWRYADNHECSVAAGRLGRPHPAFMKAVRDGRPFSCPWPAGRPPGLQEGRITMTTTIASRRSAELEKLIDRDAASFRILTGDRPTGRLHLGHYFGTLRNRVRLQDLGAEVFVLIADYQVLTDRDTAEHLDEYVTGLLLDYLAIGLDPARTVIFAHSAVPALNQLLLPFLSLVSVPELNRNPTVKDEIAHSRQTAVSGLMLTYPVHQAADILFCKANLVPVGQDQLPHLELTRVIARRFNDRFGLPVFPVPDALLSAAPLLLGTDGTKMSKSRGNTIPLSATADETARLIRGAQTDPEWHISYDPASRPAVSSLVLLAALCLDRDPREVAADIGDGGATALKDVVSTAVNDLLAPIRARRADYARDLGYVRQVLRDGNARANEIAAVTLAEVRTAMGMRY